MYFITVLHSILLPQDLLCCISFCSDHSRYLSSIRPPRLLCIHLVVDSLQNKELNNNNNIFYTPTHTLTYFSPRTATQTNHTKATSVLFFLLLLLLVIKISPFPSAPNQSINRSIHRSITTPFVLWHPPSRILSILAICLPLVYSYKLPIIIRSFTTTLPSLLACPFLFYRNC